MSPGKITYNVYSDESCHLLNDHHASFVLGAVWVDKNKVPKVFEDLRAIKSQYGLSRNFEAKWTKISKAKADYYLAVVRYFFENPNLHFRGVVVPDKTILDHATWSQDHDSWYYKMFYILLNFIIKSDAEYNLYFDIKDTRSHKKVLELRRILNIANTEAAPIIKAQQIRSDEVELLQVADILIGALSYKHRALDQNEGKLKIIDFIENSAGKDLLITSAVEENKSNILVWHPRK